jgi:hypothetical protein
MEVKFHYRPQRGRILIAVGETYGNGIETQTSTPAESNYILLIQLLWSCCFY